MWRLIFFLLLPITVHAQTPEDSPPNSPPPTENSGWVTAVVNDVQRVGPQAAGGTPVTEGDPFPLGTTHKTGANSKLRLLIEGDSVLTLGQNTALRLSEGESDAALDARRLSGDLSSGILRVLSGKGFSLSGSTFAVHTPTASAGAEQGEAYFIVWTTECSGKPATGILSLDGEVTARGKGGADGVILSSLFYTKIGEACPPPLALAVSKEVMAEVTGATTLVDPVRVAAVVMEVNEQVDPKREGERLPIQVRLVPPIAQVPNLSSLGLRVRVIFP